MRPIDADALKEAFYERGLGYQAIDELINEAPTIDAVPVARCKDCKHHREISGTEREYLQPEALICTNAGFIDCGWNPVWPDDFCRYGERRS